MNFGLVFFQFLPLLLYIVIDYWKGFRAGIIAAIIASVGLLAFNYSTTGSIDTFSLGECALILFMGVISLKMNDERTFKFQPTVLASIIVCVFISFEVKGESLLIRYIPHMERIFSTESASPEVQMFLANLRSEHTHRIFTKLSRYLIGLFFAHGLIMAYAAMRWKTSLWFMWRLAIYPALLVTMAFVMVTTS